MKVVILAGGFGTRISEESHLKPKPMIEIGDKPILWHIMKIYSHYGFNDFIICLGYKGYIIKEYFANYFLHQADVTFDFTKNNQLITHNHTAEPWNVTLVDTGINTLTGGRLKRVEQYISDDTFLLTYGDGVSDVNVSAAVEYHKKNGKLVTVTAIQPAGRFGALDIGEKNSVLSFAEKPKGDGAWINAGFFVMNRRIIDYINDDTTMLEKAPLEKAAKENQLIAYKHAGFWQPMDTMRDKTYLEELWNSGKAPWKLWK
jgi:glucose-1-phosphate cytidylyltransferase